MAARCPRRRAGKKLQTWSLACLIYAWLDDHHLLILAREGKTLKKLTKKKRKMIQSFLKIRNI
jgi:hypothetical protein